MEWDRGCSHFTVMGQGCFFYVYLQLGWDKIFFSVGVGQGRSENPLQCHRLVSSTLKQCLWSKENRALVSPAWLTRGLCLWEPWRNVVTEAYLISNLESNWKTEIAIVAQRTRSRSQFADDIFSSQQGVMCLMSALESGLHFLLNDPFFGAISACSPICLEDVEEEWLLYEVKHYRDPPERRFMPAPAKLEVYWKQYYIYQTHELQSAVTSTCQ